MTADLIINSVFPKGALYDNVSKNFHLKHPSDWRYWPLQNILLKMAHIMLEEKIITNNYHHGEVDPPLYTWEWPARLHQQFGPASYGLLGTKGNYTLLSRVGGLKHAIDILLNNSDITSSDLAALADRHILHLQQEEEKQ